MEPAGARAAEAVELTPRRGGGEAIVSALRPRQWLKNVFVLAGIVFAAKLGDASRWGEAIACFVAFCAASSASYLVNDVRDASEDRRHPIKRNRAIARGDLSVRFALGLAAALALFALGLALVLDWRVLLYVLAFLALQAAYSLGLKHVALIDVMAIGGLFVIRAAAGATAVDVPISEWLLLCTALLALFLGFAKRRGELVLVGAERTPGRPVLEGYSLELVDQLLAVVAAATIIAYGLYTFDAPTRAMMTTIPFVLFGVFRYLLLVHKHDLGEEPERVLLADRQLIAAATLWAVSAALILALS